MELLSAGIGAAGSILGGIFGKKKEKYVVPDYAGIRRKAEAAGFNPLTALTQGPQGQVVETGGYMGSAIADAAMIAADAMAKDKEKTENEALKEENAELRKKVQAETLRPIVPGIYAQREAVASRSAALGGSRGSVHGSVLSDRGGDGGVSAAAGTDGLRPIPETDIVDPRRAVEPKPVSSTSGFMIVDNPYLPVPLRAPTLDGDEPLQWYDYPSLAIPAGIAAGELAMKAGERMRAAWDYGQHMRRTQGELRTHQYNEARRLRGEAMLSSPYPRKRPFFDKPSKRDLRRATDAFFGR